MALPLIPILAGAGIGAGGFALGSLFGKKDEQAPTLSEGYAPTTIDIYSPQITDARQDSRAFVYQPVVQIESAGAVAQPRASIEQDLTSRTQPAQSVSPVVERVITQETTGAGIDNRTLIIGAVILGAVLLVPQLTK